MVSQESPALPACEEDFGIGWGVNIETIEIPKISSPDKVLPYNTFIQTDLQTL